jgi:hypothetical protein
MSILEKPERRSKRKKAIKLYVVMCYNLPEFSLKNEFYQN